MSDQSPRPSRPRPTRHEAAAICTPGLESILADELRSLGCKPKTGAVGVVPFKASTRQLYAANVWSRTASRVLVRLATFRATDFQHLQLRASEIDWSPWIADDWAPEFRVTATKSKLYHTEGIADRLHKIVGPRSKGEPIQPFVVRIDRDLCTISVDTGGTPLNHRGWRTDLGVAPIRPTMAAAMLLASGFDGSVPVLDPFCGSGTIAIEAALMAKGMAPGGARRFAFQYWPGFEPGTFASVNAGSGVPTIEPTFDGPIVEAFDRDEGAAESTHANAERAGVAEFVTVQKRVISDLTERGGRGLVVTNPPYGKRVGDGDLRPLYQRFGTVLKERRPGYDLTMVSSDRALARQTDGRLKPITSFGHGGLKVEVLGRRGAKVS